MRTSSGAFPYTGKFLAGYRRWRNPTLSIVKKYYALAKTLNPVPQIISEAEREIDGFIIFVSRANLKAPPKGPQSSGGMNPGVKFLPPPSPLEVRVENPGYPPVFKAVRGFDKRSRIGI
jgi:hypothetical protein